MLIAMNFVECIFSTMSKLLAIVALDLPNIFLTTPLATTALVTIFLIILLVQGSLTLPLLLLGRRLKVLCLATKITETSLLAVMRRSSSSSKWRLICEKVFTESLRVSLSSYFPKIPIRSATQLNLLLISSVTVSGLQVPNHLGHFTKMFNHVDVGSHLVRLKLQCQSMHTSSWGLIKLFVQCAYMSLTVSCTSNWLMWSFCIADNIMSWAVWSFFFHFL